MILNVFDAPCTSVPAERQSLPPCELKPGAETSDSDAGRSSHTLTPSALASPVFVTLSVKVTLPPAGTRAGCADLVRAMVVPAGGGGGGGDGVTGAAGIRSPSGSGTGSGAGSSGGSGSSGTTTRESAWSRF